MRKVAYNMGKQKKEKKIFKYLDIPLLIVTIFLFIVGLIMVFSSSNVTAYMSHAVSPYNYFFKQLVFLVVGLFLSLIMIRFNTKAKTAIRNRK